MGNSTVNNGTPASAPIEPKGYWLRWRRIVLGLFVALGGIALSLLLSWLLLRREEDASEKQFILYAGKRVESLQRTLDDKIGAVETLAGYFNGSPLVEPNEFRIFIAPLMEKHPEIQMMAWAPRIPAARRKAFEQAVRNEGFSKHGISRRDERGQLVAASPGNEYHSIRFVAPPLWNQSLIGFDLGSDPTCRAAIRKAMISGRSVAVVRPPLVNDNAGHNMLYVIEPASNDDSEPMKRPADQPEADGVVLGILRIDAIVKSALSYFAPVGIDIYVTGPSMQGDNTPIYTRLSTLHAQNGESSPAKDSPAPSQNAIHLTRNIEVADSRWTIDCVPMNSYLARQRTWTPGVVLLAGFVVTGLLTGYSQLLSGRTVRVERLVAQQTRELRESEQRFRRLVENAGDAFFLHDDQGKFLDVNQRACESLGYSRDELLRMVVSDFELENSVQYWHDAADAYPRSFEGVHRRKDGTSFPVEIRLTLLDDGKPRLFLALVRDITERKRLDKTLREGEQKLRAILDQTYQFIGMMTPEGILLEANKTALAFSGVPEESVRNKLFWDTPWWAHSPALREELREAVKRAAQGDFVRMEATHLAANGEMHWIDFSLKPVKDETGKVIFLIPEGRDITDRKRAEEAIHQERRLLRDMLNLNEQDRKLVAYEIHDGLAQQLTAALYRFQTIDRVRDRDPDAARDLFDEAMQLLREAMLETRRLISGLRPLVLDESGVVAAIDDLIASHAQHEGPVIEFIHDAELGRLAPPLESAVFRIVQECLTNACRYSQSKKVRVELVQANGRMRIDVQDWGIGFDPTTINGNHFGLRGIRERVRLLGGDVTIQSASEQGAHITAELPMILQTENGSAKGEG